jgi:tetratricopeptide (TPR) repeat protein
MARRQRGPNEALATARARHGWSREVAADWATRLAERRGLRIVFSAAQLYRYERQGVIPDDVRQDVLRELYELPGKDLGFPGPPDAIGRYDAGSEVIRTDRRDALKGLGALLAVPLVDAAVRPLHLLAELSLPMAVDASEEVLWQIGHGYSTELPQRLTPRLRELASFTAAVAAVAPNHSRRMRSVAGWATGLLSNAVFDQGDSVAAEATVRLALGYGAEVGDARLVAYARDRQALYADTRGDYEAALGYVEDGLRQAPPSTAIRIRLLSAQARLTARLQRRAVALEALNAVEVEFGRLPAAERSEGSLKVGDGAVDGAAGAALLFLGDLAAARDHQLRTIDRLRAGAAQRPTRLASAQVNLATIHLRLDDVEQATAAATAALESPRMVLPVQQKLRSFAKEFAARYPGLPALHSFQEQYRATTLSA